MRIVKISKVIAALDRNGQAVVKYGYIMVKVRALNANETYCCSVKAAKKMFLEENIDIFFGYIMWSRAESENNRKYLPTANSQDRIVASLHICDEEINGFAIKSFLVFYILNKEGITQELRNKFENEALKTLLEKYRNRTEGNCKILVGLRNGEFSFYEKNSG